MISQGGGDADFGYTYSVGDTMFHGPQESRDLKSAQARPQEHSPTRGSLTDSDDVRRERYRKLAALLGKWKADPAGHGKEFWPILEAELDRRDD